MNKHIFAVHDVRAIKSRIRKERAKVSFCSHIISEIVACLPITKSANEKNSRDIRKIINIMSEIYVIGKDLIIYLTSPKCIDGTNSAS